MRYKAGEELEQLILTPLCLDEYVPEGNICRIIDAFIEVLDMKKLGFKYANPKVTGRKAYNPSDMLKLYLYGYLNRVRSSRRLEAETKRNLEVMWLLKKMSPDDKTISNFRKDNAKGIKQVFREFSLWCNSQGLYGKDHEAIDSTKIRANASRKSIHSRKGTEKELISIEKKIEKYMKELEENDTIELEEAKVSEEKILEILKNLKDKKEPLENWLEQIEANEGKEISTVDPDASFMKTGGDGRNIDACYNVQTIVDDKHKLILDFEVSTCPDDKGAMVDLSESAKEIMGVEEISLTGDKGYYDGEDIAKCEKNGITCYIPKIATNASAPCQSYNKNKFRYNKEINTYTCPQGQTLHFVRKGRKSKKTDTWYSIYANPSACKICSKRELCTTAKRGRTITRTPHQGALDIVNARMNTDKARRILRKHKQIAEHPFGTIKHVWGFRQFLCRGKEAVTAEQSLAFLAYNFRRVFNIFTQNNDDLALAFAT